MYHINPSADSAEIRCRRRSCSLWDITPCRPLEINLRFRWKCRFHLQGRRVGQARNQYKTVSKQRTIRRHIPQARSSHNHRCENLKSYRYRRISLFFISLLVSLSKLKFKKPPWAVLCIASWSAHFPVSLLSRTCRSEVEKGSKS
jgi:hypothetical protein